MSDLQDLIQPKTRDEMLAQELTIAADEGLPTTSWQSGSVIRTLLVIVAQVFSLFSSIIIEPIKGGFGDLLSTLAWAKVWAKQRFNVDAVAAQPATGAIDAVNASATNYGPFQPGDLIVAHNVTGKLYRNQAIVTITASTTTSGIAISAVEVGTGSNAAPGAITKIVSPSMSGVTISNAAAVLGNDDETVDALVTRSREKLGALSPNGPKDAYNYVAKTPALAATSSPITRAKTFGDPSTGEVTVYIANASGAPGAGDVAIVQKAEEDWAEPWCTNSTATAASNHAVDVTYEVWVKSSLTVTQIQTAIADALATYFASLDIGGDIIPPATGKVYVGAIEVVVATAKLGDTPIGAVIATIIAPAADIDIARNEVPVLGTVTPTVNFL